MYTIVLSLALLFNQGMARPNIDAYSPRPDSCRTYNIGGMDSTDGLSCGQVTITYNKVTEPKIDTPVTVTPVVIIIPTTETIPDNTCKNKNSGKDGTPAECNAGKGQEKHNK